MQLGNLLASYPSYHDPNQTVYGRTSPPHDDHIGTRFIRYSATGHRTSWVRGRVRAAAGCRAHAVFQAPTGIQTGRGTVVRGSKAINPECANGKLSQ